jgi:hypothetical protein
LDEEDRALKEKKKAADAELKAAKDKGEPCVHTEEAMRH